MSSLFCPLSLSAGRFAPLINHHTTITPLDAPHHSPHTPFYPATTPSPSATTRHILSKIPWRFMLLFNCFKCCYAVFPAPLAARFPIHIAPRKIVLTDHFFSLVLMLQDARLLFCSTPSHITPHPSPGSNPTANYASLVIFSTILDVYMFTDTLRRSHHPLYMPHSVIFPQITPTLANLPPSLVTRCHGSMPF